MIQIFFPFKTRYVLGLLNFILLRQFDYETLAGTKHFGPVFRIEFLQEALRLQHAVEKVCLF